MCVVSDLINWLGGACDSPEDLKEIKWYQLENLRKPVRSNKERPARNEAVVEAARQLRDGSGYYGGDGRLDPPTLHVSEHWFKELCDALNALDEEC